MKIRSLTLFVNPAWPLKTAVIQQAADFAAAARPAFERAGFEVQSIRLATPPFPHLLPDCRAETVVEFAQALEAALLPLGFAYLSIGPALPEFLESYAAIPEVIAATKNVFASGLMTPHIGGGQGNGVSLPAVQTCAEVIHALGLQDDVGFANLYFAALANVPPGAPFFPAAYAEADASGEVGASASFAVATEAADLAVEAFTQAQNLSEARRNLSAALETHAQKIVAVADTLNLRFGGIDYSLAPFPEVELSLGTALERLGVPAVGLHGSLAAAALMTDTVDRADFPRVGFSGLMLPVLEDATLAARAAEGLLTIKDLLLYSAVCGTGLDTVPLPGETTVEQLNAILLDLAVLALRLDKPLTARLMPIPGKGAGEPTGFDFAFFANSRVLALEAQPLRGALAGEDIFSIRPRKS
jgi:uncharacterized protein (UPF0210 family)